MATDNAFNSLCKHPYISAYLDIHFSTMKKIQSQLRDSVPHCTMMSLLLEATSNLEEKNGSNRQMQKYTIAITTVILAICLLLESISLIGLKTQCLDHLLAGSLMKDRKQDNQKRFFDSNIQVDFKMLYVGKAMVFQRLVSS